MGAQRIGFLGLGAMGSGMAKRLLAAGFPVSVYNRTTAKAQALAEHGAVVAPSPGEAVAGADVVLLSLATAEVVEELLFTSGALARAGAGAVVADMSTVSPPPPRPRPRGCGPRASARWTPACWATPGMPGTASCAS